MKHARCSRGRPVLAWFAGICVSGLPIIAALAGDWTVTPRVSGQEIFTDNVLATPVNRRADFITNLSPGIAIHGESTRVRATLDYSPSLFLYALTPGQNVIGHNLYGNGTATVVPDLFFFDARAYASLQPTNPALSTGLSPLSLTGPALTNVAQGTPTSQLSQVSSFSASPYLQKRFDGFGTAELRYTLSNTNTNNLSTSPVTLPGFAAQNTNQLTNEATATFLTGENFGPYAGRLVLDAAQSSGGGVQSGNQRIAFIDSAYAITRRVAALWTIGHEKLHFGGFPPTSIDDLIWGIGTRLTPSSDTTLVLSYGHRNGVTAPYASLVYNLSARTVLSVSYSEGLSTVNQEIANNLAVSDLSPLGQTVDTHTLLPLSIVNSVLGLQSGALFHTKRLTGSAHTDLERDHFSASVFRSEDLLIAQSTPGSGTSQKATGANLSWLHDLNPLTTTNLGFGYSRFEFPTLANSDENLFSAIASVQYVFNASLRGWVGYSFLRRTSPQPQQQLLSNTVFVGLRKEF